MFYSLIGALLFIAVAFGSYRIVSRLIEFVLYGARDRSLS
jgi:hypothetical protein